MYHVLLVLALLPVTISAAGADSRNEARLKARVETLFPDLEVARVTPSAIAGLYEVLVGTDVIYVTADGRYLFQGDVLDLDQRLNVTENQRAGLRRRALDAVPPGDPIEFAAPAPKHVVYVFTDIQCGYCRRLHRDMPELNRRGISVRYLAFPRAGIGSPAFTQMESIWCAADRRQALTDAKLGRPVTPKSCANPVARQYRLGESLGVRGTPAIYTMSGHELSGYMPPDVLLDAIERTGD
jgi:thiol:disulfide interchange protein DsbC